jgi:hypothetical protein
MKNPFIFSLWCASINLSQSQEETLGHRDLVDLKERFNIEKPLFSYDTLQFDLEYVVNDVMGDNSVDFHVFDGNECQEGNTDITENNDHLSSRLRPDLKPVGEGSGIRTMKVTLNVDPTNITTSNLYQDFVTYGQIYFCVRFSVWNMDILDPSAIEVNFIETPVILTVDLVDGFEVGIGALTDADLVIELAYQDSAVEAYICDNEANVIEGDIRSQGESVRVCVVPTTKTLAEGAYLRYIEEFTFFREDHIQVAIEPGTEGAPATQLTVVDCPAGSELCAFETLLGAEFFEDGIGIVEGTGTAYLQFGQNDDVFRRLQDTISQDGTKSPQEILAERPTAFRFEIVAVPGKNAYSTSAAPGTMSLIFLFIVAAMTVFYSEYF